MKQEPVLIWTTIGALIGAALWRFLPDLGDDLINATVDAVVIVLPVIAGAAWARRQVTPLVDPKLPDGTPAQLAPRTLDIGNG